VFDALGFRDVISEALALAPFVPPQFGIKVARDPWELAESYALRRLVFCSEQRIFAADDRDDIDAHATTIVAVDHDYIMGMGHRVVGTVRIHESASGEWYGSRLAIAPAYRNVYGLGSGLIYRAVTTAHGRGARAFFAHVQRQNVAFFKRLHWEELAEREIFGHPHALMRADLAAYPAMGSDAPAAVFLTRRAS
jgi:putative N-acetyltransferase (TIGR04045 family)